MIDKYIVELGNSRPIFKLNVNFKKDDIYSTLIETYEPQADPNDPISILVCDRYLESLDGNRFRTNCDEIKKGVYRDIKSEMCKFINNFGGFKNAKQSAIFRFMGAYNTPVLLEDGLVYLYRYTKSLGMASGHFPAGTDQKHIDNILAIIELMRSKFEPK